MVQENGIKSRHEVDSVGRQRDRILGGKPQHDRVYLFTPSRSSQ
jgi:hypothetical protein